MAPAPNKAKTHRIHELASLAYERELTNALGDLETEFARWRRGEINAFDVSAAIHDDVLQRAIEGGGDADTIGSMTGQIAGAAAGATVLPDSLVSRLRDRDQMLRTAETFAGVAIRVALPAGR